MTGAYVVHYSALYKCNNIGLKFLLKSSVEKTTPKYTPSFQTPPPPSNHQSRIHLPSFSFHDMTTLNASIIVFLATSDVASSSHLQDTFKPILHLRSFPHTSLLILQTTPSAWLYYSFSIFQAIILLCAYLTSHMLSLLTLHFSEVNSPS